MDDHVETVVALADLTCQSPHVALAGQVTDKQLHAARRPRGLKLRCHLGAASTVTGHHQHARAGLGQPAGGLPADAAGRAGDKADRPGRS